MHSFDRWFFRALMMDSEDGGGSGGSGSGGSSGVTLDELKDVLNSVLPQDVIDKAEEKALRGGGDATEFAKMLLNDNKKLRDKLRKVTESEKGVTKLTGEEAEAYSKIKMLFDGKIPEDLPEQLREIQEAGGASKVLSAQEKLTDLQLRENRRKALEAAGVNVEVWEQLSGTSDLPHKVIESQKTEDGETKTIKIGAVQVTEKDDAGNESTKNVPIRQYIEDNYAPFKEQLLNDGSSGEGDESGGGSRSGGGVRIPGGSRSSNGGSGSGSGKSSLKNAGKDYVKQRYGQKNSDE